MKAILKPVHQVGGTSMLNAQTTTWLHDEVQAKVQSFSVCIRPQQNTRFYRQVPKK